MALASSSLHITANFWAGAGVAVALVAIAVSVILWLRGSPQRLLLYSLTSETALLSEAARQQAGPDLQVTLRGEPVDDPRVVSISIESRSRRDIRNADFENGIPLRLSLGSSVLRTLGSDTGGDAMPKVPVGTEGSTILVGPGLIKKRQVVSVDLLTDGPVALTCSSPALADVTVRMRRPTEEPEQPKWLMRSPLIGALLLLASSGILYTAGTEKLNIYPFFLGLCLFTGGLMSLFGVMINYTDSKRRRAGIRT